MSSSITSTLHVSASTPATINSAGYALLTYTEVLGVVSIGAIGETSADVNHALLKTGYTVHGNGAKDVTPVTVTMKKDVADAGQIILLAGAGTSTIHSIKITDEDGNIVYAYGVLRDYTEMERTTTSYTGVSVVFQGQAGTLVRV